MEPERPTKWYESLFEAKASQLVLYGRALGLSHGEAEDVLQETFVALMRRDFPPTQPEYYCVRSYRNHALNHKRSLWRRLTRELESAHWFERYPSGETDSERAAMQCLRELSQEQREVIVLKIWHSHTFQEISELLALSPNTVAGRYRYGINKIKKCLEGYNYERDRFGEGIAFVEAAENIGGA